MIIAEGLKLQPMTEGHIFKRRTKERKRLKMAQTIKKELEIIMWMKILGIISTSTGRGPSTRDSK